MKQPELATCQCIIAHPSKPKFMAIRHSGGYLPPTVKIPLDFPMGSSIGYVLEGIQRKYGLKTIALRHLARFRDYQCIELEVLGTDSRRLQAVWVGQDDYTRIRGGDPGEYDPLADWLAQQTRGEQAASRPPWQRPGWFDRAVHWIDFQLDRMNVQRTGSVAQHRALSTAGTVLRIPTSGGGLFFKASYTRPPPEVALTRFLSEKWPDYVSEVLVGDEERNWMLMPNHAEGSLAAWSVADHERVARTLGKIQCEGVALVDELMRLECEDLGLRRLKSFLLSIGGRDTPQFLANGGLSDSERAELAALAPRLVDLCDRLAEYGLPDTLVHPDVRFGNIFVHANSVRFIDWSNTHIGHPFFSLMKILRVSHPTPIAGPQRDEVIRAYLSAFCGFGSEEQLLEAFRVALRLEHAWRLLRWCRELPFYEPGSLLQSDARKWSIDGIARQLLEAHTSGG